MYMRLIERMNNYRKYIATKVLRATFPRTGTLLLKTTSYDMYLEEAPNCHHGPEARGNCFNSLYINFHYQKLATI